MSDSDNLKYWYDDFRIKGGFTRVTNMGMFVEKAYQYSGNNGMAALVAIIVFAWIHLAWKKGVLQKELSNPSGVVPARAVWLWSTLKDSKAKATFLAPAVMTNPTQFLAWAKKKNVNQLWIDIYETVIKGKVTQTAMASFCLAAKQAGVMVNFICLSDPIFATDSDKATQQLNAVYDLIATIPWQNRPVGIMADIEPGPAADFQKYIKVVSDLRQQSLIRNQTLEQYVNLSFAINFWLMGDVTPINQPGWTNGKFVGEVFLEAGVDVVVMDYHSNFGAVKKLAQQWAIAATTAGQFAWICLEANAGSDPNYSGKPAALDPDIVTISLALENEMGFATMVVDDANGYANILP